MSELSDSNQQRRTFLGILLGGIGVALGAAAAWPVWRFLSPRAGEGELEKISIDRSLVTVGAAHFFNFHGQPAVVLQASPGQFLAFSAVCTHLGCVVKWVDDKGEFLCPCHGGRFSVEGTVLGGPPPAPLGKLPVSLEGDRVLVG